MMPQRTKRPSTPIIAVSGMLAALVALATMLFRLPVPITQGYVHLGDTFILFSAMLVGPIAAPIGGIGSALADLLAGYPMYILPTLCIKALVGWIASWQLNLHDQHALLRCALTFTLAEVAMVAGYFAYEIFVYGFALAIAATPANLFQGASSVALACALLPIARRVAPMIKGGGKPL
ncbi:MAG: ECF transporter S component [Clostridia bacterium]|nr:ECF transporter S component [Clostridia bacterium]